MKGATTFLAILSQPAHVSIHAPVKGATRSTDVRQLATVEDAFGDLIGDHTTDIINEADILVPCWGKTAKVPPSLQFAFDVLMDALLSSGKPVKCFGLTASGDPRHPLMLGYSTPLVDYKNESTQ